MKPQIIQLRDILEDSTNDVNQIACAMEMVLDTIFEADSGDGQGRMETIAASYPVWREVLAMAWQNLLRTRDKMADGCMTVESGRARSDALSARL